jgi:hypothetical protein
VAQKTVTASGITASKIFDGTTTFAAGQINVPSGALSGIVGTDDVYLLAGGITGSVSSAGVGTGKVLVISGLSLGGADAANYVLGAISATASITENPGTPNVPPGSNTGTSNTQTGGTPGTGTNTTTEVPDAAVPRASGDTSASTSAGSQEGLTTTETPAKATFGGLYIAILLVLACGIVAVGAALVWRRRLGHARPSDR